MTQLTSIRRHVRSHVRSHIRNVVGRPGGTYSPANDEDILQLFNGFSYAGSTLDNLPILQSEVGTLAVPRGQRCVLFDGVNDIATRGARLTSGDVTQLTVHYSVMQVVAATNKIHIAECDLTVTQGWEIQTGAADATRLHFFFGASGFPNGLSPTGTVPQGEMVDICWVYDGTQTGNANRLKLYRNGVAQTLTFTGTIPASIPTHSNSFTLGGYVGGANGNIKVAGLRVYSVSKTVAEVLSICQQHLFPATVDLTGALAIWPLQEESGTVHYDISGNGRNLTATNITQSTYHATDAGVKYSFANELGYTQSGSVVIPRNEAVPTQDVASGALQFAGPIALSGVMEVPCLTVSGTEYLDLPHLTGSETVVAKVGTSTVSVAAGRINLTAGTVSSILLSDGTNLPLQDGPGSSNTNRTCYNVDGTGRHATLTNGTVATMWAGRLNTVRDWCLENGGGIAVNGAFIPGRIGSSLDAAGNAKTLAAGEHRNPFSRFDPNNWSAPSLVNIGSTASDAYAPSGMAGVQAESVADTRFASQKRYAAFRVAQTGADKTNAEDYVS